MTGLIFLVGLSGSGKSTAGRLLSRRLQLPFIDLDTEIERRAGRSIETIFAEQGEPAFRQLESELIAEIAGRETAVVATGGGAPTDPQSRAVMRRSGSVVWLDAASPQLAERLDKQGVARPLLPGDPLDNLERLRAERQSAYADCGPRVDTGNKTPAEVVDAIVRSLATAGSLPGQSAASLAGPIWVHTQAHSYPIYVGAGLIDRLSDLLARHGLGGRLHVIVDEQVDGLHGQRLRAALANRAHTWRAIPAGEEQKTLEHACGLLDALLSERPERSDTLVAIGGGVVGDLVGFLAATLLRGVGFVQVPTTVLSQVDSSVGGKTGVDHPRGKNLIGAFYQPNLVVADLDILQTLPPREIAAGLAEIVKIAVVQDRELFEQIESSAEALSALQPAALAPVIRRAIELKAHLVEQDERDILGIRALLNYGHTLGHALEAATDYGTFLHGEAIAVGMTAAGRLAAWLGLHPLDAVDRQDALLRRLNLPLSCGRVDRNRLVEALALDKKRENGKLTWILPAGLGKARSGVQVTEELVNRAIDLIQEAPRLLEPANQLKEEPS